MTNHSCDVDRRAHSVPAAAEYSDPLRKVKDPSSKPSPEPKPGRSPAASTDWIPAEGDIHLRIWLADQVFDYMVAVSAIDNLIQDWMRRRWCTLEIIRGDAERSELIPRLPCERLFQGK